MSEQHPYFNRDVFSTGNLRDHSSAIAKSLGLVPVEKADETIEGLHGYGAGQFSQLAGLRHSEDAKGSKPVEEKKDEAPAPSKAAEELKKCGYDASSFSKEEMDALEKAIADGGQIISKYTGQLMKGDPIPMEAFAKVDEIKIGDRVQLLNWKPLGVCGAKIDLFPQGKVTKIFKSKCQMMEPVEKAYILPRRPAKAEGAAERIVGVLLNGRGPVSPADVQSAKGETHRPYILKDSSVVIRFPAMAQPSGEVKQSSPGLS